jgi:hypothetical protein
MQFHAYIEALVISLIGLNTLAHELNALMEQIIE